MNSFNNTESIFTVVGDYPVVDQFDILYSLILTGSTTDNYITGTLLYRDPNGQLMSLERGLAFSKLGIEKNSFPGSGGSDTQTQSYDLQPWRERSGTVRSLRIFSNTERFYDSLTPTLSEIVSTLGGKFVKSTASGDVDYILLVLGNDETGRSCDGFIESFPFEPKFGKIQRVKRLPREYDAKFSFSGAVIKPYISRNLVIKDITRFSGSLNPISPGSNFAGGYWLKTVPSSPTSGYPKLGPVEQDLNKVLFGFGDARTQQPLSYNNIGGYGPEPPQRYGPMYRKFQVESNYDLLVSPVIRGWKYGLISADPYYTSAVFRRDKFGQFRDMLEQRQVTRIFLDTENSPTNYFGSFETPALPFSDTGEPNVGVQSFTDGVVTVKFIKRTFFQSTNTIKDVIEKPENTQSSNLDLYFSSSLPYFDGVSRNRAAISTLPGKLVLVPGLDSFGNNTV